MKRVFRNEQAGHLPGLFTFASGVLGQPQAFARA